MDVVEIPNACVDESFKGSEADTLDHPRPEKTCVVGSDSTSPCTADYDQDSTEQV